MHYQIHTMQYVLNEENDSKTIDLIIVFWIFDSTFIFGIQMKRQLIDVLKSDNKHTNKELGYVRSKLNDPIKYWQFNQYFNSENYQNDAIIIILLSNLYVQHEKSLSISQKPLEGVLKEILIISTPPFIVPAKTDDKTFLVSELVPTPLPEVQKEVKSHVCGYISVSIKIDDTIESLCGEYSDTDINDLTKPDLIKYNSSGTNKTQCGITNTYIEEGTLHNISNNYYNNDILFLKIDYRIGNWTLEVYNYLTHKWETMVAGDTLLTLRHVSQGCQTNLSKNVYASGDPYLDYQVTQILFQEMYDQFVSGKDCSSGNRFVILDRDAQIHALYSPANKKCKSKVKYAKERYTLKWENIRNSDTPIHEAVFWTNDLSYYYTI